MSEYVLVRREDLEAIRKEVEELKEMFFVFRRALSRFRSKSMKRRGAR